MRKIYFFLICMFSFAITVNAQVTLQQDTTSFNSQMSAAFANLQTYRVPFWHIAGLCNGIHQRAGI